jgi:ATP-dependent RNA helicase DHX8/PRP22
MYDKEMLEDYEPEIVNTNLSTIILQLHKMGINLESFLSFKFISAPTIESVVKSVEQLFHLEAMDEKGIITDIGKSMTKFQIEVTLARCLIESYSLNCIKEIIIIISVLQINELFFDTEKIDKEYTEPMNELITMLNTFKEYLKLLMFKNEYEIKFWCFDELKMQNSYLID